MLVCPILWPMAMAGALALICAECASAVQSHDVAAVCVVSSLLGMESGRVDCLVRLSIKSESYPSQQMHRFHDKHLRNTNKPGAESVSPHLRWGLRISRSERVPEGDPGLSGSLRVIQV